MTKRLIPFAFFLSVLGVVPTVAADTSLFDAFSRPPSAARPRVWWHWMNGNVSKAGITADLEAMAKAGIGGAHLFDVGCGIPPGDVKFNTPSWDEHVDWAAREAERLGLELTLVNCSGYANAGGPWIAPSNSMFFVQHTEALVRGGATFRGVLPRTKDDNGFYRDIAVIAFPRPVNEREPSGGFRVEAPSPWVRVVSADSPFLLGGFTFSGTYGWGWNVTARVSVEASDDGQAWRETEKIDVWLSNSGRSDCNNGQERYVAFTRPTRARHVRVSIEPEDKTFVYTLFRPELRLGLPELNARTFRSYDVVAPCAYEVEAGSTVAPGRIVDLTDRMAADGTLDWTAPAGDDWIVLRVGYASNGAVVHPASAFGGGLEVNKLDAAAVGLHFDSYAGRLAKGRDSIKSVLCDSYEVGTQNWTHGLEKTFAARKGYSFVPYLVAFSGRIVGSVKKTDEVLWDFRRLVSDLFVENFVTASARKARAAGLRYAMEPYGNMSADCTHYAAEADLPMTEFWVTGNDGVPTDYVGHSAITKAVASAAHLHGRDTVDAEAFTAFPARGGRWTKDPFGLKAMGDFYYTLGVTRMVYHRFAHQPWTEPARLPGMTMGQWGTHFERTETWWPMVGPWLAYQSRCQALLAAGHPANSLLVYAGDAVPNTGTPEVVPSDTWDVCGMHDLEELSVVGGNIVPRNAPGVTYAALVVPTNRLITAASRAHLERLRAAGAMLLKSGEKPPFAPAFTYSGTDEKVRWICRRHDDGTHVFFVAYPSTNAAVVRCSFRMGDATPQLWDAESGERFRPYDWKRCGDRVEVTLPFKPCGSWFVVFSPKDDVSKLPVLEDPAKRVPRLTEEVGGNWRLTFPKGWNCPAAVTLPKLVSWTEIPDGEARYFSGIATYEKTVDPPNGFDVGKDRLVLDLGRVKNVAEVTVNGRTYPPLWRPPFRVDVTDAVRTGEPLKLSVRVANLWPNRLIGDEQKAADCEWGYKWDALAIKEIPAWVKAGKPSPTGRLAFTTWHHWTKDDALLESGLIGPVRLEIHPCAHGVPAGGWRAYEGNPVLGNAKLGTCFDVNVVTDGPAPYTMYFSWRGRKSIALVRSTDGFAWTQEPEICLGPNPSSGWEEHVNRSCTVKKDGLWHMWYTGQVFVNGNWRDGRSCIGYATSTDGVHFMRVRTDPVMVPELPFEKSSVMNPYVRWDAARGVWRMWYAAGEIYEPNVLCYAESADGLTWTKRTAPIFAHGAPLAWDRDRVGACEVHPLPDGRWAMFYIGYSDIDTARIGCAISRDGITGWRRLAQNPIVSPDLGTWNGSACYKPSVVRDDGNGRWLLWYNGRNGAPEYVGMAVHEGLDLEAPSAAPADTRTILSDYVRRFNAMDDECYTNAIPDAAVEGFMQRNCPRLACPDKDIERTYYFRWWTFRKHLKKGADGTWRVTEFLPKVGWSGTDNTIVCPAGHHLREGRWLRDPQYLEDAARFWLASPKATHRWGYSSWLLTGTRLLSEVSGHDALPGELLDDAVRYYERWVEGFVHDGWPARGKFTMGGDGKGGFLSIDNFEGTEISLGGHGYKPLFASAMWSEAKAIAAVARQLGKTALADAYERKAEVTRQSIFDTCWNPDIGFFTTARTNGVKGVVRELHGYAPWYFGLPTDGRKPDWAQLADFEGFAATYGLTFPERRAKGFAVDYKGHECKWNGPSWPFATSVALTALANDIHAASGSAASRLPALFTALLHQYADAQRRTRDLRTEGSYDVVPWIDENLHPDKPEWLSRRIILDTPSMRKVFPRERGKDYNHSTFCDLVISGLVGFVPNGAEGFTVDPLFPADWNYLVLEDLRYRGHDVTIHWQRGCELEVTIDGRPAATRKDLGKLRVALGG